MEKMNNKIYYHYCYVDTFYNIILKPRLRKWRFPESEELLITLGKNSFEISLKGKVNHGSF